MKMPPYLLDLINAVPHQSDEDFIVQMGYQQIRNHMTALLKAHDLYMTFHDLRHIYTPFSHNSKSTNLCHYPPA